MVRTPLASIAPLAVLAALAWPVVAWAPERSVNDRALSLNGLERPVRVVTDRWGIPHLSASSLPDLYFAWGFVTARDRLWQLEVTRRGASGTLWEWFGNRTLTADGGAQLFELKERAERIWARERARPSVREPLERYTAGINAYIGLCQAGIEPWPDEFQRLHRRPALWEPQDVYLVLLGLGMLLDLNLPEIEEAREVREHGMVWVEARRRFECDMTVPSIPDSVAERLYGRPRRRTYPGSPFPPATRTGARVAPRPLPGRRLVDILEASGAREAGGVAVPAALLAQARRALSGILSPARRDPDQRASNVFAVGPRRSSSGAPLLANDVHLGLAAPGPLHAIHLTVPGALDAAGACVPGLPVIVSGRNARCAWGLTALNADVMDVYADTLSADGRRVRWRGAWVTLREAPYRMRYRVLGVLPIAPPGQKRRYGPHGPVVAYDRKHRLALSVRWAGDDPAITLGRSLGIERLGNADDLAAAVRAQVTPTNNIVAADRDGDVVYQTVGALPRRGFEPPAGLLPDDGRHEWLGLIAPGDMPRWKLGPSDFVVNGNNLPVGPPYSEPFPRYDFMQDRAARMAQRLAADASMTLGDLCSVQNDVYSRGAARFLPLLVRAADSLASSHTPRMRAALDTLRGWDLMARRDRVAPTLFRAWLGALQRRNRLEGLPMLAAAALDGRAPAALRAPGKESHERPAVAATEALRMALIELERRLGPDLRSWRYGKAHQARFRHALAWRDSTLQPPPLPADGDQSTVSVGRSSLPWSVLFTHGPVWRHVVDLAVAESSLCILPPGNAGQGPHARDHLDRWANHTYVPLYLSWNRIEAARESEWRLAPGAQGH